jgi:dCMP deaminase
MMTPEKARKYLKLAKVQAELFSKDPHTKVAAIILSQDAHVILATGYNGIPRGMNDGLMQRWERPEKYRYVVHAECNAICNAARSGMRLDGAIAVVTMFPCADCAKMIIQSGIRTVIAPIPDYTTSTWGDSFKLATTMFKEVNVDMLLFKQSEIDEP